MSFLCVLCDEVRPNSEGAHDAVERALGDCSCGCGVCDSCWAKLPEHAIDWAEERDERLAAHQGAS